MSRSEQIASSINKVFGIVFLLIILGVGGVFASRWFADRQAAADYAKKNPNPTGMRGIDHNKLAPTMRFHSQENYTDVHGRQWIKQRYTTPLK